MATVRLFSSIEVRQFESRMSSTGIQARDLLVEARKSSTSKTVFLSHSSKDDALVPAVILLFQLHGATVYADDFDKRLPNPPNPTTAQILKSEIKQCPKLVVLATPNSHTSRWIPWELGLGDGMKGVPPNAILPSTPDGNIPAWLTSEYFHIYPRIVLADGNWYVTAPATQLPATPLKTWLAQRP